MKRAEEFLSTTIRNTRSADIRKRLLYFLAAITKGSDLQSAAAAARLDERLASQLLREIRNDLAEYLARETVEPATVVKDVGRVIAYSDGASRGNPGEAACAVILTDDRGEEYLRRSKRLGRTTNNVAEYEGVLLALELAHQLGAADLLLKVDSELVAKQISGEYRVKHPALQPLHERVLSLAGRMERFEVMHVPREQMKAADKLANDTLDGKA